MKCNFYTSQGRNTHKNKYFSQDIFFVKLFKPPVKSIRIKNQVGLKELSSGIDFLMLPHCLEMRL